MLIMKKASIQEKEILSSFYKNHILLNNIDFFNEEFKFFIALEDNFPKGFSQIKFIHDKLAEISLIYIDEKESIYDLGDGLLRATLNYIKSNNYNWTVIKGSKELENFLYEGGLKPLIKSKIPNEISDYIREYNQNQDFFSDIQTFFSQGCKHSK
ncbi:MAG: hypothetical protein GX214_07075 [Clostridiales bacterium]|nr:hypothetical protein [Clostridiales bacterium]